MNGFFILIRCFYEFVFNTVKNVLKATVGEDAVLTDTRKEKTSAGETLRSLDMAGLIAMNATIKSTEWHGKTCLTTKALERATSRYRDDKGLNVLKAIICKWHAGLSARNKAYFARLLKITIFAAVEWEGAVGGWTQEALDDFTRVFCPSFKRDGQ